MVLLVTFVLLAYGWTNIMVYGSSIIETWRNFCVRVSPNFFGKLFGCPMCLGTWVGFLLSYGFQHFGWDTPMTNIGVDEFYVAIFLDGIFTSGAVWILHTIQEYFERA